MEERFGECYSSGNFELRAKAQQVKCILSTWVMDSVQGALDLFLLFLATEGQALWQSLFVSWLLPLQQKEMYTALKENICIWRFYDLD